MLCRSKLGFFFLRKGKLYYEVTQYTPAFCRKHPGTKDNDTHTRRCLHHVHHAGEPAAVLLPPCRGTPRPWKLLQESTPWPSPGVLNSLNIHQPSPQHERKRKKSTLTAVGPPAGTQIRGAQPRGPPGRALQVATQGKKRFVPFRNKREAD